jgi:type IV fimbrial biogenesis protein FimT
VIYHGNGRLGGDTTPSFDISATGVSTHRCVQVDLSGHPYQTASAC